MEDITKFAVAAGVSIPVARQLYKKYKDQKVLNKYNINKAKLDDYLPYDIRNDILDTAADIRR